MDAATDPQKSFSVNFLGPKMRFVSIMVLPGFFVVLNFVFQNFHAQRAKWTFLDVPKNVQKMGGKLSFVDSGHRPISTTNEIFTILNEIFSAEKSLKHKLA